VALALAANSSDGGNVRLSVSRLSSVMWRAYGSPREWQAGL
jgi:hypothetical protein